MEVQFTKDALKSFKRLHDLYDDSFLSTWQIKIRYWWLDITSWFRVCFNKHHYKFVKEAFTSYPWDFIYIYRVEREQLKVFREYFKKGHITTTETYAHMIYWITVLINLLDIIIDDDPDKSTFEYDGVSKFVPCEDNPEFYKLDQSGVTYRCNVKVNLKNIDRFIRNEHMKKYALEHPHELYEIKAKYLYHKIKYNYIECFWD